MTAIVAVTGFLLLFTAYFVYTTVFGPQVISNGPQVPAMAIEVSGQETFDYVEGDSIALYHATGDELATENIQIEIEDSNGIVVSNFSADNGWTDSVNDGTPVLKATLDGSVPANDTFAPGDTFVIEVEDDMDLEAELTPGEEYTIRIVHQPTGSTPAERTIELP